MSLHVFKIDQQLIYRIGGLGSRNLTQSCKVIRLLPAENGEPQYRIKCTNETFERVAREGQLSRH